MKQYQRLLIIKESKSYPYMVYPTNLHAKQNFHNESFMEYLSLFIQVPKR
jgi:hypothetical protein